MPPPPKLPPNELRPHVGHPRPEGWADAQWREVAERLDARGHGWRWAWVAGALAMVALLWWQVRSPQEDAAPVAAGWVEAAAVAETFALRDGSQVQLAPAGRLHVDRDDAEQVRLALHQGRGHFEVTKKPERSFEVEAQGVVVRVVGTVFDVALSDESAGRRVRVAVQEGIVEVTPPGGALVRLEKGESWTMVFADDADPATPPEPAEEAPAPSAAAEEPPPAPSSSASPVTAKALFERAMAARRASRFPEAAAAFEELLRRYPNDARASLAAMELGRLRADHLDDADGAARAFEQAEKGDNGLAEDALARRVRSLDQAGDEAACRAAASRYLAKYPQGARRAEVEASCQGDGPNENR